MVLLDEPEISLHADAQHLLRRALEDLSRQENIQVVYATHSPSMLNTMRPGSVRVGERSVKTEVASSVVRDRCTDGNYASVRSSLGLSAADSLLYAPITIVVEGASERYALPILLSRLQEAGGEGFHDAQELLSHSHFLDGEGDSIWRLCRVARSQGTRPIIFVDGDKRQPRVQDDISDVPVIQLEEGREFEDLFPRDAYLLAIRESAEADQTQLSDEFSEWEANASVDPRMMFTKRVERWLTERFPAVRYVKPKVAKICASSVDIDKVNSARRNVLALTVRQPRNSLALHSSHAIST